MCEVDIDVLQTARS